MPSILIAGSGQIGSAVGQILSQPGMNYSVVLADLASQAPKHIHLNQNLQYISLDVKNQEQFTQAVQQHKIDAVVACLPYFLNLEIAKLARKLSLHYFDLTEDVEATAAIADLAQDADRAFIPQCGVAPGFINIVANDLMKNFDRLDSAKLRCGALPAQADNMLQYALTWSIDGLINEYGNPCPAIAAGKMVDLNPLSDLEMVELDGLKYEAFNTSGGLGSLISVYDGKIETLNYKTLRYPGHCEKMSFLMNDLKLNHDRPTLINILKNSIPHTQQDVVLVFVSVQGQKNGDLTQENYMNKFYPAAVNGQHFTAIQMTTATSVCIVVDTVLQNPEAYRGFIYQSQFNLKEFLKNKFAAYFNGKTR